MTYQKYCCHEKVVAMATKANLINSVNLPSMKIQFCQKISFNLLNLSSGQERHIYHDSKVVSVLIILSPEPRFQTET